jgi:uncharacterized protein (DUF697 family)/tellurite resistance protein
MTSDEQKSILAIALYATFADGLKDESEREAIRRIADSLVVEAGTLDLASLYQDVLLKRLTLESAASALTEPALRQLAYEMAVCACDADGRQNESEQHFLANLKTLLRLESAQVAVFESEADAIVTLTESVAPAAIPTPPVASVPAAPSKVSEAELDKSILNYSLVNGGLELLPQSWASLAVIPLQIKMVYGIGKSHGVELDQGHIKEFIAAAGLGLSSQYLEQIGRKLLGGLLGKAAGKLVGKVGRAATGVAFSFATTYALGQLAKRYYSGGRVMNAAVLRETFQNLLGPARQMQTQYMPQIQQQAATLDMGRVMAMVRGA